MDWNFWETITGVLVNVTVLLGAVIAVVKLRLYNLLSHRYQTEVQCTHVDLSDGRVLFCGDYIIHNTGEREIWLTRVDVKLLGSTTDSKGIVRPDKENILGQRPFIRGTKPYAGIYHLEAGERTIFPLRCNLDSLDEVVFLSCSFGWDHRRKTSPFISLYIKSKQEKMDEK